MYVLCAYICLISLSMKINQHCEIRKIFKLDVRKITSHKKYEITYLFLKCFQQSCASIKDHTQSIFMVLKKSEMLKI